MNWSADSYLYRWTNFLQFWSGTETCSQSHFAKHKHKVTQDATIRPHSQQQMQCHLIWLIHAFILFQVRLRQKQSVCWSQHPGPTNKEGGAMWRLHSSQETQGPEAGHDPDPGKLQYSKHSPIFISWSPFSDNVWVPVPGNLRLRGSLQEQGRGVRVQRSRGGSSGKRDN